MSVTVNDDRSIEVILPISQVTVVIDSPKGKHLRKIQSEIRKSPEMNDAEALVVVLSQLVRGGYTLAQFDELDFEDIEVLGNALKSFRAFGSLGTFTM